MLAPAHGRTSRRRGVVAAIGILAIALLAASCAPPPPPPPPAPVSGIAVGIDHPVAQVSYTFTDTSRGTDAYGAYPGEPFRTLPTKVLFPADRGGPYPLVTFVPGYGVDADYYAPLLTRIARAGYVVAAPSLPLLSGQPAGPTDQVGWWALYPDVSYVTSSVLFMAAMGDPSIGGLIDGNRLAVAGHSDGGAISYGMGFNPGRLDGRYRAVVSYAADLSYYPDYQPNGRPILHVLTDQDVYNPYGHAIDWDNSTLQGPKTVLSLWNASHAEPFTSPADAHFDLVAKVTVAFLDATTKGHPERMNDANAEVTANPSLAAISSQ